MALPACGRSARRSSGFGRTRTEFGRCEGRWSQCGAAHTGSKDNKPPASSGLANTSGPNDMEEEMVRKSVVLAAAVLSGAALATPAAAQNEQFVPILSYRTGAYAVNGVPYANGVSDYYGLVNERDGGINGVKLLVEECETAYATDKGVECYERLKGKGPTSAAFFNPLSTGI